MAAGGQGWVRDYSQIVWYNSKWGRIQRKKNVCIVCVCLCAHAWMKLCVLILSVCGCIVVTYSSVLKIASSMSWGGSPMSFLTRNTCFLVVCLPHLQIHAQTQCMIPSLCAPTQTHCAVCTPPTHPNTQTCMYTQPPPPQSTNTITQLVRVAMCALCASAH